MKTFEIIKNGNFATVYKQNENEFVLMTGYVNPNSENDPCNQTTCTDRKFYKTEKMAIKKANQFLGS